MRQMIRNMLNAIAYMFRRKGFLTRKIVVATLTLIMMLYIDTACHIWDGMGLMLLVLLTVYVIGLYTIRYMDMKRIDEEQLRKQKEAETKDGVGESNAKETDGEMEANKINGMENEKDDGNERENRNQGGGEECDEKDADTIADEKQDKTKTI